MKGFDSKFKNFPDYIIGITKEIWEGRNIASLHNYYDKDIIYLTYFCEIKMIKEFKNILL